MKLPIKLIKSLLKTRIENRKLTMISFYSKPSNLKKKKKKTPLTGSRWTKILSRVTFGKTQVLKTLKVAKSHSKTRANGLRT